MLIFFKITLKKVLLMFVNMRNILRKVGGDPSEIAAITQRIAEGDLNVDPGQSRTGIGAAVGRLSIAGSAERRFTTMRSRARLDALSAALSTWRNERARRESSRQRLLCHSP